MSEAHTTARDGAVSLLMALEEPSLPLVLTGCRSCRWQVAHK